jgi:IMP cyclohydrolase
MKMPASTSSLNNIDLNVVPDVQHEVWHPTFITRNCLLTINDSIMLHNETTVAIVKGMLTPRNKGLLARQSNAKAINDSLTFSI